MSRVRRINLNQSTTVTESTRVAKKNNLLVENKREKCLIACEMGKSGWSRQATSLGANPPFSSRLRGSTQIRQGICALVSQNAQYLRVLDILALEPFKKYRMNLHPIVGFNFSAPEQDLFATYLGIALCPRLQASRWRHI